MPLVMNMADTIVQPFWDTNSFAAGATVPTDNTFFNQPIGTNSKTKLDTNMTLVQQLPPPKFINVTHIRFGWNSDAIKSDIDAVVRNYVLEFWVGEKSYFDALPLDIPAGFGLTGTSTATSQQAWNNGWTMLGNARDLRLPAGMAMRDQNGNGYTTDGLTGIIVPQSQTFYVRMYNPGSNTVTLSASGNGLRLRIVLETILSRQVQ